ncbi:aspartate carbamoyltransferase [Kurthia zopfii]|uniref:Aspartate carbamoyltransferase n=1 Tax=Kurthia zopfii TaxID=1650 RepID=A0A2U3AE97_9BACL|nr:aspartate carbamoyltransferase catalytic subunit [Kurthia zopfii]PWI22847.1 aspartate carbamoyltransferase [Kurthia zopfii]TDR40189.1 aspartate carbamoyltransferase [Kurthia zopfii]STX09011.1 Aspartate carbamoyltransferase [Kurthia zopfii]VEI04774.1 Aspartate carbamoyltransferase [Kurthia zopfii]GEK30226.1 aspartate carbamoyltransferase [Kurthia zopfii]
MKNLLSMDEVSTTEIMQILERAAQFEAGEPSQLEKDYYVSNLFFEPSTRTKTSFESAERRIGATVIPFDAGFSSVLKGETLYDTVKTIQQSGIDAVVIRHKEDAYYEQLLGGLDIAIINAGDGTGQHPSQSLLDLYTIFKEFGRFEGINVTIAGDVAHSRVAKSDAVALTKLGANVNFVCPPEWQGEFDAHYDWDQQIETSDVIMLLRVQHERDAAYEGFTKESYHEQYGLTIDREKQMKDGAIIMHPAPINRGVEIDTTLVECERSRIFAQMKNGLFIRMAILEFILKGRG